MENVRTDRLLRELRNSFSDARADAISLTGDDWTQLRADGLEKITDRISKLSVLSPEYRVLQAAFVLLYPHLEAWTIVSPYRQEILDSTEEEQLELLHRIVRIIAENTRSSEADVRSHIYAFWPVESQSGM